MARRRALALCAALSIAAAGRSAAAAPRETSEYRLWAGVRHPGELLTANVLTTSRLAFRGLDALDELAALEAAPAVALRSAELVLIDLPVVSFAVVVPHEAFGHAARMREFDARPRIHFDLPLPYSLRADHHVTVTPTRPLYNGEESVVSLGGLAVQEGSQRMLAWTTFRAGVLRRGEAILYTATSLTHAGQMLAGSDLVNASNRVRPLYRGDPDAYRALARAALVLDLLDPMFLHAAYASMYSWLVRGDRSARAPAVSRGGARFFATSRTMPVPWGVEHQLHVLAAWPWATFDLGLRTGVGARRSFGVELSAFDWRLLRVMRAGAELALWVQPVVGSSATLGPPTPIPGGFGSIVAPPRTTSAAGGAARVRLEVDRPRWMLGTRLGWKSAGLWGERELAEGFEVALTGGLKLD